MTHKTVAASLSEIEERGIDHCTTCPKLCRWACPVAEAEARETSSPWNLVILGGMLKKGIASAQNVGHSPYLCTHCGACTEACLHKNDVPLLLSLARSRLIHQQAAPEEVSEVRGHFGVAGNALGLNLDAQVSLLSSVDKGTRDLTNTVYVPGCSTLAHNLDSATDFLRFATLQGLRGISVSEISGLCCGLPLFWAGDLEGFRSHALRYADRFKSVSTVVVHDAACAHALLVRYPEVGVKFSPKVEHVASFLSARLPDSDDERPESDEKPPGKSIAYMDTCHLSRGLRVVNPPRRLLRKWAGRAPAELPTQRGVETDCCGAGGLLPLTAPNTARAMGEARIALFRQTGAEELVTFSPRCAAHLKKVDPSLDVVDVSTVLLRAHE